MPGGNGRGPAGMGPMTGWGRGSCASPATAGQPFAGRGFGRGGGGGGRGWRNQFYATGLTGRQRAYPTQPTLDPKEQTALLKEQAEYLSGELEAVRSRLNELEQKEKK
jgi:hypothetical protein